MTRQVSNLARKYNYLIMRTTGCKVNLSSINNSVLTGLNTEQYTELKRLLDVLESNIRQEALDVLYLAKRNNYGMKREKIIKTIELEDNKFIEVTVRYIDGSLGAVRGYYLSVNPYKRDNGFITYVAYSGMRYLLEEVSRYSQKKLDNLVPSEDLQNRMIESVRENIKKE